MILWQTVCVFDHARNMYPGMLMSIGPPFWSRLKYLNQYKLDYHEIWYKIHDPHKINIIEFTDFDL